jgi:ubiquinone/menaquinone biosynthesis C-methylase UbiE
MGCGFGRMALPLIAFLDKGSYEGFDVHKKGIEWCLKHISEKKPNFKFNFTDVYNLNYNPTGTLKANTFQFPYANEEFDFCFATSLFTHLKPSDIRNYIKEMSRVLNSGGRCLVTAFLIDEDALLKIKAGAARYSFSLQSGGFYTSNKEFPEEAIAYSEDTIIKYFEENGLVIDERLYGFWSGVEDFTSFQDILIVRKIKKP